MFNNPYNYNQQSNVDRINSQIAELEKLKQSLPQNPLPTNLTQNFQLAPTNQTMKYANSMEDVKKEIVVGDTPYFSKDLSIVWIKNTKGEVKAYELKEIVQKDEKDLMIENLQLQVNELTKSIKEMIQNAKPTSSNDDEPVEGEEPSSIQVRRTSKTKSK